jgi:hypothetical protein
VWINGRFQDTPGAPEDIGVRTEQAQLVEDSRIAVAARRKADAEAMQRAARQERARRRAERAARAEEEIARHRADDAAQGRAETGGRRAVPSTGLRDLGWFQKMTEQLESQRMAAFKLEAHND